MLYKGYLVDTADAALTTIRRRRSHTAIETEEQESYLEYFRQMLHSLSGDDYRKEKTKSPTLTCFTRSGARSGKTLIVLDQIEYNRPGA
ncbi:hypothetical protein BASA60_011142 [Batrachochytrium salamandrivorans]|nr:hypothetical protein BASA60_011142 [Batrachochytrium salamandrivorans]